MCSEIHLLKENKNRDWKQSSKINTNHKCWAQHVDFFGKQWCLSTVYHLGQLWIAGVSDLILFKSSLKISDSVLPSFPTWWIDTDRHTGTDKDNVTGAESQDGLQTGTESDNRWTGGRKAQGM